MEVQAIPVYVTKHAKGYEELVDAYAIGLDGRILIAEDGYVSTYPTLDEVNQAIHEMHPRPISE